MFYQGTKSMKAAVIGTIMPWSGALSEIPDGWIICDGSSVQARDFPLLTQAIGDTYNLDPDSSNLGGGFPNYEGDILLPNLNGGKVLMDIEEAYFASAEAGGTGKPVDTDPDARNIIAPYIGTNIDTGAPAVFTDVFTDVVFTLNDRLDYSGSISGNTVIDGVGEKIMYIGGRKLGHTHIRQHSHSGVYETINANPSTKPGKGVVPWDNIQIEWRVVQDPANEQYTLEYEQTYNDEILRNNSGDFSMYYGTSGLGGGQEGRTVAIVGSEQPPINLFPFGTEKTPIATKGQWYKQQLNSEETIDYALGGGSIQVPLGLRNYYPDATGVGNFGTLVSNSAGADWLSDTLLAHAHEPFEIIYDQGSLKPQSRLIAGVNIPITTNLDNATNVGALQIDMNTSQPSLTCVYIIRAY